MMPIYSSMRGALYLGDCLGVMRTLPDESINCCITSPPYWGLRDYGEEGQIGLEDDPERYTESMVSVFRELRRILRNDGTLWLNLGDSYTSGNRAYRDTDKRYAGARGMKKRAKTPHNLKQKELVGIPWRVALALQQDGWYLRQDIIWHKPNPMPESVRDRCTKAHEYIFLLTKSPKYYYDYQAIKEKAVAPPKKCGPKNDSSRNDGDRTGIVRVDGKTRNKRSVWTVGTRPYKGAHFATFPPTLVEPCVLAGCPEYGLVYDPFMGTGTTAEVAQKNNRLWLGSELSEDYCMLIKDRLDKL